MRKKIIEKNLKKRLLEGDDFSARSGEDQWRTAVALFHRHKVLLVWDNFESTLPAFQVGEETEPAVETSRRNVSILDYSQILPRAKEKNFAVPLRLLRTSASLRALLLFWFRLFSGLGCFQNDMIVIHRRLRNYTHRQSLVAIFFSLV